MGIWHAYVNFLENVLSGLGNFFSSGAIAIIVFTIIVKTLILPLTVKSIKSSKAMQELGPKIKEIQKKHGNDRQAASQEQMALYQAYGVNPMAGCLPMLVQMPIFMGVYFAIRNISTSTGNPNFAEGFWWVPNLGEPDPWHILPIVAGIFQWIQSRMMRPANQTVTDPQQQMMNTMMNFMPLTVVLFGWSFAAGPVLYWVIQAIYSVFQQWIISGWGAFGEWFPWLPELPEHRRLGYAPARNIDDVTMVSGEPPKRNRMQQWMDAQVQKAEATKKEQEARRQAALQEATKPKRAQTPAAVNTTRRDDYQSRVDAASRYSDISPDESGAGDGDGTVISSETVTATGSTARRARRTQTSANQRRQNPRRK